MKNCNRKRKIDKTQKTDYTDSIIGNPFKKSNMKKVFRTIYVVFLSVFTALFSLTAVLSFFFMVAEGAVISSARCVPAYEKENLAELLKKETWTEEDYRTLYYQTGLSKSALDKLKGDDAYILSFQEALFYSGEVYEEAIAFTTSHDRFVYFRAPIAPLEDGDVLVTSTCHTFGWRNGHAALVVNAKQSIILESYSLGLPSEIGGTSWFQNATNFLVLRLKDATEAERADIAAWALSNLYHIEYSIFVGINTPKDQGDTPQVTHCSHLVWQAFYHFGYDIDPDGGAVCTSRDIANSPHFEVVQAYGFDLDKLWH